MNSAFFKGGMLPSVGFFKGLKCPLTTFQRVEAPYAAPPNRVTRLANSPSCLVLEFPMANILSGIHRCTSHQPEYFSYHQCATLELSCCTGDRECSLSGPVPVWHLTLHQSPDRHAGLGWLQSTSHLYINLVNFLAQPV